MCAQCFALRDLVHLEEKIWLSDTLGAENTEDLSLFMFFFFFFNPFIFYSYLSY